jgi:hypothetical protein
MQSMTEGPYDAVAKEKTFYSLSYLVKQEI